MRFAVAIVAPPGYPYHHGFREVAETVHHGLAALGHDSVLSARADHADRLPIVFGTNTWGDHSIPLAANAILYNLEQIYPGSPWLDERLLSLYRQHPVWDYSRANIAALAPMGVDRVAHVPIGYMPQLTRIAPAAEEDIDILFYGALVDRRLRILRELRALGLRVEALFGVYGEARDRAIARAKIILNLHLHEAQVFEIVRVSYLLANRRFVISEPGTEREDEDGYAGGLVFADYGSLVGTCLDFLNRPAERAGIAQAGFRIMAGRPETECLRAAIIDNQPDSD